MSLPPSCSVKLHARRVPAQELDSPPHHLDATSISGVSGLAALMKRWAAAECSVNNTTRDGGTLFTSRSRSQRRVGAGCSGRSWMRIRPYRTGACHARVRALPQEPGGDPLERHEATGEQAARPLRGKSGGGGGREAEARSPQYSSM